MSDHRLYQLLTDAAAGSFPPVDGQFEVMAPDDNRTHAIVEFTGHAVILGHTEAARLDELGVDGFGGASHPTVQLHLAGDGGFIGCHDVVLACPARRDPSVPPLEPRADLDDHPRVLRSRQHRRNVAVLGDDTGVVTVGEGLVGRTEISIELTGTGAPGSGRRLLRRGIAALEPGTLVFAQVTPGNAASLRAFLACGFVPICSEILIHPEAALSR